MNRKNELFKNFLLDLITLLKEDALDAKKESEKHMSSKNSKYHSGVLMGYYEVLDTIKNQLFVFQIKSKEVNFNINPEDLFSNKNTKRSTKK